MYGEEGGVREGGMKGGGRLGWNTSSDAAAPTAEWAVEMRKDGTSLATLLFLI